MCQKILPKWVSNWLIVQLKQRTTLHVKYKFMLNKNLLVVFTNNFLVFFFENLQNGANWMGSMDTELKKKIKTYGKLDYLQIACLCVWSHAFTIFSW